MASWQIEGQYMETCNCDFLCPCITSNLAARPTEGDCKAAIAMKIDRGSKDGVTLDGLAFVVLLHAPGPMAEGNMKVGVIVDEGADDRQAQAIGEIASGAAGGPMAALAPLVAENAGMERRPIRFDANGLDVSVTAGELVDQRVLGLPGAVNPEQPLYVDNTPHPVNSRLGLGRAARSRMHAFGIDWEDDSGSRNGHLAPFSWSG